MSGFNAEATPILDQIVNDEPLVYLDNAADNLRNPRGCLAAIENYYLSDNANVHRVHTLPKGQRRPMKQLAGKSSCYQCRF